MKQQNKKCEYIRPELIQLDMGIVVTVSADDPSVIDGNQDPTEGDEPEL